MTLWSLLVLSATFQFLILSCIVGELKVTSMLDAPMPYLSYVVVSHFTFTIFRLWSSTSSSIIFPLVLFALLNHLVEWAFISAPMMILDLTSSIAFSLSVKLYVCKLYLKYVDIMMMEFSIFTVAMCFDDSD